MRMCACQMARRESLFSMLAALPLLVAAPHDETPADGTVADPLLLAAQGVAALDLARCGLQRHRVRTMGRLGQREGAGQLAGEHRHAVLGDLLRAAAVDDRTQGQAALHADDRGHRAVAAGHLHIDQASGQRAHLLAALDR